MRYYIYGLTSKGNVRENNEDCILVHDKVISDGCGCVTVNAPFVTAVCDGVGGENAGELAAQMCLEYLSQLRYRSDVNLKSIVTDIHNKIKKQGVRGDDSVNMQTTLCLLAVDENGEGMCVNVGDSRMYRYVNAAIRQISTDQSYRQYIYEHGGEGELARLDPRLSNAIVSSVGSLANDPEIEMIPLVTKFGKEPDDMIIIMSDGISDYVSEQQLEIGMGLDLPIGQKLEAIAQLALDNGSEDNISIIGIKPFITKQELEAITSETGGRSVNIQDLIKETDKLGDILTLDINDIISGKYTEAGQEQPEQTAPQTDAPQSEPVHKKAEPVDIQQLTQQAMSAVENNAETAAQSIREMDEQEEAQAAQAEPESEPVPEQPQQEERTIPQELVGTTDIGQEFKSEVSKIKDMDEEELSGETKGGKTDFHLHTVELLHQSASSLARLEKLFGKK